jgi:putative membrane protein
MPLGARSVTHAFTAYCGHAPDAATIWSRWNLDPILIAVLLALGSGAAFVRIDGSRRKSMLAGWAVAAAALVSPLCALSVSLFSARVLQHMVLAFVAAPLVALGMPRLSGRMATAQLPAALCFAALLWLWHLPAPYAATFDGWLVYWLMHLTTFSAALWLWISILGSRRERLATSTAASLFTGLQMSLLGAVITFAGRAIYSPHEFTTFAWGLTPLQDQQLGGAIMWIPAGVVSVAAIVLPLHAVLRPPMVESRT